MKLAESERKRKILLVYNTRSGNGLFTKNLDYITEKVQERGYVLCPIRGTSDGVLDYVLDNLHEDEFREIIVAGGDGTINLVVNAMMRHNVTLPLAIFPAGTANDFAYYYNVPNDIDGMINVALGNEVQPTDIPCVNGRYFVNVAAIGAIHDVSQKADQGLKNALGMVAYYMAALGEVKNIRPVRARFKSDEFSGEEEIFFMVVMNGRSAGGFKNISPKSDVSDGKLDVLILKKMPLPEILPLFIELRNGKHTENKNVISFSTSELEIESLGKLSSDIDGEKGEEFPLHFTVAQSRIRVFSNRG